MGATAAPLPKLLVYSSGIPLFKLTMPDSRLTVYSHVAGIYMLSGYMAACTLFEISLIVCGKLDVAGTLISLSTAS